VEERHGGHGPENYRMWILETNQIVPPNPVTFARNKNHVRLVLLLGYHEQQDGF
jgi:hypothetical protein